MTVTVGEAAAARAPPAVWTTALTAKRPMWLVRQMAVNVPSCLMRAWVVGAQAQPVSCPRRSISTMAPASFAGALPLKRSWLRSTAEARLASEMPLPLVLTITFAGWTVPFIFATGALLALIPAPPVEDDARAGPASRPATTPSTAPR